MSQSPHNAASVAPRSKRHYTSGEVTTLEEDMTHEFKGHMNLSEEEIPRWITSVNTDRRSRMPISRTLNAFLNTGLGGTVYLGIVDSGEVKGLNLTQFKKDHLIVNLDDVMDRYTPKVERHRYKIQFVPVVPPNSSQEEITRTVNFDSKSTVDPTDRQRPHTLRSREYCWCDKDTMAQCSTAGKIPMQYVVEITIKPWDPAHPKNQHATGEMKTHPLHTDECGNVYFRRQASVMQCSKQEILQMSRNIVAEHYQPKVDELKEEIFQLREALAKM